MLTQPTTAFGEVALHTEAVACNLCGCTAARRLFTETYALGASRAELGINLCRRCSLIYVSPRLTPESTQLVYQHDAEDTISHHYCWDGSSDAGRFRPLLRRLSRIASGGQFLDVGCGGGQLLVEARRTGRWHVVGVEPVVAAAHQAASYSGATVHATTLEQAPLEPESFDVITLLGVLEHVHDPTETLRHAYGLLRPGGALAVYVPNFNYLRCKDAGIVSWLRTRRWSVLHPQEHQFQYTPRTLKSLLTSQGFELDRLDLGQPFAHGSRLKRTLKGAAFAGLQMLYRTTGIHLAGIEAIARRPAVGGLSLLLRSAA